MTSPRSLLVVRSDRRPRCTTKIRVPAAAAQSSDWLALRVGLADALHVPLEAVRFRRVGDEWSVDVVDSDDAAQDRVEL